MQPPNVLGKLHDQTFLHRHWRSIRSHTFEGDIQDKINFTFDNFDHLQELRDRLLTSLRSRAKLNYSFGFALKHQETGELRYFHPSQANALALEQPIILNNADDIENAVKEIQERDVCETVSQNRPDTKWSVEEVYNVTYYVDKISPFAIGKGEIFPRMLLSTKVSLLLTGMQKAAYFETIFAFSDAWPMRKEEKIMKTRSCPFMQSIRSKR